MGAGTQDGRQVAHGHRGYLQPIEGNYAVGCAGAVAGDIRDVRGRSLGETVGLQTTGNSPPPDRPLLGTSAHGAEACTTQGHAVTAVSGGGGAGAGMTADAMDSLQAAAELAALFSQQPSPPPAAAASPKHQQAPGLSGGLPSTAGSFAISNDAPVYNPPVVHSRAGPVYHPPMAPTRVAPVRPAAMVMRPIAAPVRPAAMVMRPAASPPPARQQGGDDSPEQDQAEEPAGEPAPAPWQYSAEEDETPRQIAAALGISVKELVSMNKAKYKRLNQHSKLMEGTELTVPGTATRPPPKPPTARRKPAPKAVPAPKPRKPATAAKPKVSREHEQPRSSAAREHAPEVETAIGPIRLRAKVWVKWVDGDGEYYGADVTNVSKTRGVTVRYPDTVEWAAWTEVLAISDCTAERVRFEPAPRKAAKPERVKKPSPETGDEPDTQNITASRRAPSSWSAEEDEHLIALVAKHGEQDWVTRAKDLGTHRTAKACQTRYRNHLRFRSEQRISGKRKVAETDSDSGPKKRSRTQLEDDDAPRRSSRAEALKQVTYNDDDAFEAMEADLESPAPARPGIRGKGRATQAARSRDTSKSETAEDSDSASDSSDSESTDMRNHKRRAGDDLISEAELERLRRQQLRWLRLQEERDAAEAAKKQEEERERQREESRRKTAEAKKQRKQAEAARRAKLEAERLKQREDIDRAMAEDEEKLAMVVEGSVDAPADDESAKKAEKRLRAKQRGLMRLMKQLHVDAQAGLAGPERNSSLKVRASAPVRKFSPEKEDERPQWSSSKPTAVQRNDSCSDSGNETENDELPGEKRDETQTLCTESARVGEDRKMVQDSSPRSPDTNVSPTPSVAVAAPKEIASCGDDKPWDRLLGRSLQKTFEGHGVFSGIVTSYEDQSSPRVYTVRYDDGDEEDLEEHELAPLLLQTKHVKQEKLARARSAGGKRSSSSPGESSDRRWDDYLVGSAIQYRLPFASGRGSKSEKQWMWLRGVVKRTCKSHADWVHVAFDNSTSFDVQVLPASRGVVWCIEPQA